jgi:hypothetical protein
MIGKAERQYVFLRSAKRRQAQSRFTRSLKAKSARPFAFQAEMVLLCYVVGSQLIPFANNIVVFCSKIVAT